MHGYRSSHGNPRRESNPWIEDNLEKEIKRLKDEKLVEKLSKNQTPLTVCPLSNIKLRVFNKLEDHNIKGK